MLHAARHHEQLAALEVNDPVPQLEVEGALQDEEELVGIGMGVPAEGASRRASRTC